MPNFILSALEVCIGIALLYFGGELFVQGSIALSLRLGIPQLIIGLTVVSLGTSAPELFVSVSSLIKGSDAIAVSNVVGSNIFNMLVVLGSSALIIPLKVKSRLVKRDVPLLLAISVSVWGMASNGKVTWQSGIALLVALTINTLWEIRTIREEPISTKDAEPEIDPQDSPQGLIKIITLIVLGIGLLNLGANFLVSGATKAAIILGISEVVVGLTIVSIGTSLPELVTSIVAAAKGRTDLAIGNVVGSNLLNQLLVLGTTAIFASGNGLLVDNSLITRDMPVMIMTTIALYPIFWSDGKISRSEGFTLLVLYTFYIFDQVIYLTNKTMLDEFRLIIYLVIIPFSIGLIGFKSYNFYRNTRV